MALTPFRRDDEALAIYFGEKVKKLMGSDVTPGIMSRERLISEDIKVLARTAIHFAMNAQAQEEAENIGKTWHATKASMRL